MKILVTDGMDKTALEQLKKNGHEVTEQFLALAMFRFSISSSPPMLLRYLNTLPQQ